MPGRKLSTLAQAMLLAVAMLGLSVAPSLAVDTITVNQAGDEPDLSGGTDGCDVDAVTDGSQCTLRAAIETANAMAGQHQIEFDFPGTGPVTIQVPTTALPTITQPLVIDGYSVANSSPNTASTGTNAKLRIVLKGTGATQSKGLTVDALADISGLVVQDFGIGIFIIDNGDGTHIWGNFIGTTSGGTAARANRVRGIFTEGGGNVLIGGTTRAERNLVSGNQNGIATCFRSEGSTIIGNLVGVAANGTSALGNKQDGVVALGSTNIRIGGEGAGEKNVIAFNGIGVALELNQTTYPHAIQILANSIYSNHGLGIDLRADGLTPNDGPGDPDKGANDLQNFPKILSAITKNGKTTIKGELISTKSRSFTIRIFKSPSGNEGKYYVTKKTITTNAAGKATFTITAPSKISVGNRVTATVTDKVKHQTSEFSAARTVSSTTASTSAARLVSASPASASASIATGLGCAP